MPPKLSYIVCTSLRSGSTFVCDLLRSTGVVGRPREYFEDKWRQRIVGKTFLEINNPDTITFDEYFERVLTKSVLENGVFGLKIMAPQFFVLLDTLKRRPSYASLSGAELVEAVFPGARYIFLTRRDKIRQAISLRTAIQSGVWSANHLPVAATHAPGPLSMQEIDAALRLVVKHEAQWQEYFSSNRIQPLTVVYEDFCKDPDAGVKGVLQALGLSVPSSWSVAGAKVARRMTRPDADRLREEYLQKEPELKRPDEYRWSSIVSFHANTGKE